LLEALGQTNEFEREMSRKYSMPVRFLASLLRRNVAQIPPLSQFDSISALSAARSGHSGPATAISVVFEPYLGIVVDAQDK
jgi:vacuolar protein sorting-associated protein 53